MLRQHCRRGVMLALKKGFNPIKLSISIPKSNCIITLFLYFQNLKYMIILTPWIYHNVLIISMSIMNCTQVREAVDQIANEFEFKTAEQVCSSFLYKSLTHFRNIKSFHLSDLGKTSPKQNFFFWALPPPPCTQQLVHPFVTRNVVFKSEWKW